MFLQISIPQQTKRAPLLQDSNSVVFKIEKVNRNGIEGLCSYFRILSGTQGRVSMTGKENRHNCLRQAIRNGPFCGPSC